MNHHRPSKYLRTNLAQAIAGHPADFSAFSEEDVLRTANENGVVHLLGHKANQGPISGISEAALEKLNAFSKSQASQDLILNHDTKNLLAFLAENDIPALLLKGTPLSLLHYEKPYLRVRCDTDLYIKLNDVDRIAALLNSNAYEILNLGKRTLSSKQFQARILTFQQISSTFDIHYRLSNRPMFQATLPFEECWQDKQPVPALGPNAWALSTPDLLIHACIHRIAHGRNTERNRLIWLYDIHLLWDVMDDGQKTSFIEKALNKKIGALCADALKTSEELFTEVGAASAAIHNWINELQKHQKSEPSAPLLQSSKLRWAWADLMSLKGVKAKTSFAKELLKGD